MKKAIVTGASGFIGRNLVMELVKNDIEVFAVVRPKSKNIKDILINEKVKIIECDLKEIQELDKLIIDRDIDVFYHFAWEGVYGDKQWDYYTQLDNVRASIEAVNIANKIKCKRFIGAGSIHEVEGECELLGEHPVNRNNIYKIAKKTAHYMCKVQASTYEMDFIWPLITNTYGEGEKSSRLINTLITKLLKNEKMALTGGNQLYDFIYVTDTAYAFYLIGEKGIKFKKYVIGSGNVKPLKEYLIKLRDIVNCKGELGFGELENKGICLPSEAYDYKNLFELEFFPQVSFEKGIEMTSNFILEEIR